MILRDEYQMPIHELTVKHCKESLDPAIVAASVGAGKTINIAALAKHVASLGGSVLVLARQGELVNQNSKMAWKCGLKNSVFSASLNTKSTFYPVVFGTEGTVARSLTSDFKAKKFDIILIDECFTPDTLILTDCGYLKISDPVIKNKRIACLNELTGEIEFDYPINVWSNGVKSISRVRMTNGDYIECTKNHKIYAGNCWVKAQSLHGGQSITSIDLSSNTIKRLFRASAAVVKMLLLKMALGLH